MEKHNVQQRHGNLYSSPHKKVTEECAPSKGLSTAKAKADKGFRPISCVSPVQPKKGRIQ